MSFKRAGDDSDWLGSLKRRRIAELMSENIPEEEAFLMRNGRFSCRVCHHSPVFDTVAMLAVHRQGRKHQASAERASEELLALELERMRRLQQQGGQSVASPQETLSQSTGHLLSHSKVYDPRVKRKKTRHGRLMTLDVSATYVRQNPLEEALPGHSADKSSLAVSSGHRQPQTVSDFVKQKRKTIDIKPYVKRDNQHFQHYVGSLQTTENNRAQFRSCHDSEPQELGGHEPRTSCAPYEQPNQGNKGYKAKGTSSCAPKPCKTSSYTGRVLKKSKDKPPVYGPVNSEEKVQHQEKILQAIGSGWVKDWTGKWVKDENAEFDSDEEPPDI